MEHEQTPTCGTTPLYEAVRTNQGLFLHTAGDPLGMVAQFYYQTHHDPDRWEDEMYGHLDFILRACNAHDDLLAWTIAAFHALQRGVDLMPIEQLAQWDGVRAVLEACPLSLEQLGIDRKEGAA